MDPVTVAVFMREPGFARDLARGMAEQELCLNIIICESEIPPVTEWEVLVTDLDPKVALRDDFRDCRVVCVREPCLVSNVIRAVMEMALSSEGERTGSTAMAEAEKTLCRMAGFWSAYGGSGVTSVSITAGRLLSGAYGERVLYLPLTYRDGSLDYRTDVFQMDCGSAQELAYRMKYGRPYHIRNFISSDEYGLKYLSVGLQKNILWELNTEELDELIRSLRKTGEFDWIIADCGSGSVPDWTPLKIRIDNIMDCRDGCRETIASEGICVRNHDSKNISGGIIHDNESFLADESGKVEISMSKSYAEGVKILVELLMEGVSKPAETW